MHSAATLMQKIVRGNAHRKNRVLEYQAGRRAALRHPTRPWEMTFALSHYPNSLP